MYNIYIYIYIYTYIYKYINSYTYMVTLCAGVISVIRARAHTWSMSAPGPASTARVIPTFRPAGLAREPGALKRGPITLVHASVAGACFGI